MVEQRPVQTSAVYLLGTTQFPAVPPPSPPSPVTPVAPDLCIPIEELDLGDGSDVPGPVSIADDRLAGAVHVLNTEATTLQCLTQLYSTDAVARDGFSRAVAAVTRHRGCGGGQGGKLVIAGVGKSGHIGRKLVATFNSLGVHAAFLHPTEALHGDLGQIGRHDTLLLITFSGRTPELLALLPHLDPSLPLILLTAHTRPDTCELLQLAARRRNSQSSRNRNRNRNRGADHHDGVILLPAPIHEPESVSFGVSAPTSSTTAALAVGDALAIVAARELHGQTTTTTTTATSRSGGGGTSAAAAAAAGVAAVFATNHPGGAIGGAAAAAAMVAGRESPASPSSSSPSSPSSSPSASPSRGSRRSRYTNKTNPATLSVRHLAVPWSDIPAVVPSGPRGAAPTGADVLRAGYASPSGWVRLQQQQARSSSGDDDGDDDVVVLSPSRIRGLGAPDMGRPVAELLGLAVGRGDFVSVAADTTVRRAAEWIGGVGLEGDGDGEGGKRGCARDAVVGVVEGGECVGVLEVGTLIGKGGG